MSLRTHVRCVILCGKKKKNINCGSRRKIGKETKTAWQEWIASLERTQQPKKGISKEISRLTVSAMALLTRTRSKSGFSRRATADLKKKERKGRRRRRWEEMKGRCNYSSDNSVSACRWTRHCSSLNNIWRTHNVLVMSQEVDAVVTTQIQQSKKTTTKFCSVD